MANQEFKTNSGCAKKAVLAAMAQEGNGAVVAAAQTPVYSFGSAVAVSDREVDKLYGGAQAQRRQPAAKRGVGDGVEGSGGGNGASDGGFDGCLCAPPVLSP